MLELANFLQKDSTNFREFNIASRNSLFKNATKMVSIEYHKDYIMKGC